MKGSPYSICQRPLQGSLRALVLDNGVLRLTILPELGGKIVSLIRLESGYEYLLQPTEAEHSYAARCYAGNFEDYARVVGDERL